MSPDGASPPKNPRFRHPTPLVHDDGSPIPAEWGLQCPHCGYELTGLTVRRCPECGRRFDPHGIWISRRHKEAGVGYYTPAYVVYGGLVVLLMIGMPIVADYPRMAIPLVALPIYEVAAFFLNRNAAVTRAIVIGLVIVACILVRVW